MTYRGDLDAAQARADALERELAETKGELAELKGEKTVALAKIESQALSKEAPSHSAFLGAPKEIDLTAEIEGEIADSDYVELIQCIHKHLGTAGMVSSVPGSFSWTMGTGASKGGSSGWAVSVTVLSHRGRTTVRVQKNLRAYAGGIFGGVGGGVGGNVVVHSAIWPAVAGLPVVSLLTAPIALAATWWGCRAIYRRVAKQQAKTLSGFFEDFVQVCERVAQSESGAG